MATLVATRAARKASLVVPRREDNSYQSKDKDVQAVNFSGEQSSPAKQNPLSIRDHLQELNNIERRDSKMEASVLREQPEEPESSSKQSHAGASITQLHELSLLPPPPNNVNGKAPIHRSATKLENVDIDEPTNTAQSQSEAVELKERVPYTRPEVFIFPHRQCEEFVFQRASDVIYQLYYTIQDDISLWSDYNDIHFRLFLCGPNTEVVQPSIICFCKPEHVGRIRQVLAAANASSIKTKRKRAREFWRRIMRDKKHQTLPFNIVYWVSANPPYKLLHKLLHSTSEVIRIVTRSKIKTGSLRRNTLCGSSVQIWTNDRTATIACMVQIDSKFYALTVAHPFIPSDLQLKRDIIQGRSISREPHGTGQEDLERIPVPEHIKLVQDDLEYEFPEPEIPDLGSVKNIEPQGIYTYSDKGFHRKNFREHVTISSLGNGNIEIPDLDWALIELQDDMIWPNMILTSENMSSSPYLESVASSLPEIDTEVLILVANREPLKGLLFPRAAILGGVNRPEPLSAWEIGFGGGAVPVQGDSGALVADAKTHVVYAYMIALGPFGNAYAVPLADCFQQIRDTLNVKGVSLPATADTLKFLLTPKETYRKSSTAKMSLHSGETAEKGSSWRGENPTELDDFFGDSWVVPGLTLYSWNRGELLNHKISLWEFKNLAEEELTPLSIIVANFKDFQAHPHSRRDLELSLAKALSIPPIWSSEWCKDSTGYFEEETDSKYGELDGHNTWFRLKIKQLQKINEQSGLADYQWLGSKIFTRQSRVRRHTQLLLLNSDEAVLSAIMAGVRKHVSMPAWYWALQQRTVTPHHILSVVAEAILPIHYAAVQTIADLIVEIQRRSAYEKETPNILNAAIQHAMHVTRALKETYVCVRRMLDAHMNWRENPPFKVAGNPRIDAFRRQTTYLLENIITGLESLLDTAALHQQQLDSISQLLVQQLLQPIKNQSDPGGSESSLTRRWHKLNCFST